MAASFAEATSKIRSIRSFLEQWDQSLEIEMREGSGDVRGRFLLDWRYSSCLIAYFVGVEFWQLPLFLWS